MRKLLQGTAQLEFWLTYDNAEAYQMLDKVEQKFLGLVLALQEVHVVEHEEVEGLELGVELGKGAGARARHEARAEVVGRQAGHPGLGAFGRVHAGSHGLDDVRLAETCVRIQEERVHKAA